MTSTAYRIAPAPKFAAMTAFDCAACGHAELGRPVFLMSPAGQTVAMGTGCAAKALGLSTSSRPAAKVVNAMRAEAHRLALEADLAADRKASAARALADYHALDGIETPDLNRMRRNYHGAKKAGRIAAGYLFPTYLADVAATGNV